MDRNPYEPPREESREAEAKKPGGGFGLVEMFVIVSLIVTGLTMLPMLLRWLKWTWT